MKSITLNEKQKQIFDIVTRNFKHVPANKYEKIRINDNGLLLVLYDSGKLVYNEGILSDKIINILKKYDMSNDYDMVIGSDETGKGEWYGPLVTVATAIDSNKRSDLEKINVKDSKKIPLEDIKKLYNKIQSLNIDYSALVLKPIEYNKIYSEFKSEGKNLNHLLAYTHRKVIEDLIDNSKKTLVVIDKFDSYKMNDELEYINLDNVSILQESNAEKWTSVATSSIIAKYLFEKCVMDLSKEYNINLRKNKPNKINKNILNYVAKTHFKNVKR
ncbi:MAG: hypothetical protein Q4Q23_02985 [Methanobacteriaceae archaeon]|nr:hypothetical protein [Methanobacteriaceae archaeon]